MKKTIVFLFWISLSPLIAQDYLSTFYISPGCQISYDFKENILFTIKISLGRMSSEENYYNITLGKKIKLNRSTEKNKFKYDFFEIQYGSFLNGPPMSLGGGFGVANFLSKGKKVWLPKTSFFVGGGLFCTVNHIFKTNYSDIGLQLVVPIAFNERYRTFNQ